MYTNALVGRQPERVLDFGHGLQALKTIAIANPRSGSGKTATTHALGVVMAERGWRVLLIDLDPQASLTSFCGIESTAGASLAEVLGGALPGPVAMWDVLREVIPGMYLFLAPADLAMASTELGLSSRIGREIVLRKTLASVSTNFDVALIDCPSSLSLLTVNALSAAQAVLVPSQPDVTHVRGLWLFLATLAQIRQEMNADLEVLGILLTPFDGRMNHHRTALQAMRAARLPLLPVGTERQMAVPAGEGEEAPDASYFPTDPQAQVELATVVEKWLTDQHT
ncbi:MAG TPA: AAA family ATPase [Anaerolineales bacterium]|nr:AAA family ATPase [Anaerolineales bacterium]